MPVRVVACTVALPTTVPSDVVSALCSVGVVAIRTISCLQLIARRRVNVPTSHRRQFSRLHSGSRKPQPASPQQHGQLCPDSPPFCPPCKDSTKMTLLLIVCYRHGPNGVHAVYLAALVSPTDNEPSS